MSKKKFGEWEYSEEELKRQLAEADEQGAKAERSEPAAQAVRYDNTASQIVLDLIDGSSISFPLSYVEGLEDASPAEIADIRLLPGGDALRWDSLDIDLGVPEIVSGIFGTRAWMAKLGQIGGRVKSPAKAAAARKNGKKGGRPRKATPTQGKIRLEGTVRAHHTKRTSFASISVRQIAPQITLDVLAEIGMLLYADMCESITSSAQSEVRGVLLKHQELSSAKGYINDRSLLPTTSRSIEEANNACLTFSS